MLLLLQSDITPYIHTQGAASLALILILIIAAAIVMKVRDRRKARKR